MTFCIVIPLSSEKEVFLVPSPSLVLFEKKISGAVASCVHCSVYRMLDMLFPGFDMILELERQVAL